MIQVTQVISYLRNNLPSNFQVDGGASIDYIDDNSRIMVNSSGTPIVASVFVMLGTFTATTVAPEPGFRQDYDERLVIVTCTDNTQDKTGKYAQAFVPDMRKALFTLLLNYPLDPRVTVGNASLYPCHNLQYVGDSFLKMDRARYWHHFEFKQIGLLDTTDGYQLELPNFESFFTSLNSPDPNANNPLITTEIQNLS